MRPRLFVTVHFGLAAGWAIGAAESDVAVDQPLVRGVDGRPVLPPSSLAGSLRDHARRSLPPGDVVELFGPEPPKEKGASLTVSPLSLLGTRLTPDEPAVARVGSTAINAERRVAAEGSLRLAEVIDESVTVAVYLLLELDGADQATTDPAVWAARAARLLTLLQTWQPAVGRGRSTGRGKADLVAAHAHVGALLPHGQEPFLAGLGPDLPAPVDAVLTGTAATRAWLADDGPTLWQSVCRWCVEGAEPVAGATWSLEIALRITEPLHIGTGTGQRSPGGSEVSEVRHRGGRPHAPGSGWKGLLRARFAYILRAVGTSEDDVAEAVRAVFGSTDAVGALIVRGSDISDEQGRPAAVCRQEHNAIDRITGGVRDGLLFAEDVVPAGSLTLTLEERPGHALTGAARLLLLHVLRDLDDGLLGVGAGTTRGQGRVSVEGALRDELAALAAVPSDISSHISAQAS